MILEIHPQNPQTNRINQVAEIIEQDGVVIFPTGSTYVFGCAIESKKAMRRIEQLKQMGKNKFFTFVCSNPSQFEKYTKGITTPLFRTLKTLVPGPYSFVFEASKLIPKVLTTNRSTIGVKMPRSPIALALAEALNRPIVTTSLPHDEDTEVWYPWAIEDDYGRLVDIVVDGGELTLAETSMIDFSQEQPVILREGAGDLSWLKP